MQLVIDPKSHLSLKPLIGKNVSGVDVEVVLRNTDGKSAYSVTTSPPHLNLDSEIVLFSPNVICRYLMQLSGKDSGDVEVDNWLEWESSHLQPFLYPVTVGIFGGPKPEQIVLEELKSCFEKLESSLAGKKYFMQSTLTAVDVVIWSSLYPLLTEPRLNNVDLSACENLRRWFSNLANEDAFQTAVDMLHFNKADLKKSLLAVTPPFLPISTVRSISNQAGNHGASLSEKQSLSQDGEDQDATFTPEEINEAYQSWSHGRQTAPLPRETTHPILPQEGVKNILITSALPYVNNVPHLGNIIGSVLSADAFARYCRLRNYNTLYICGTDEYGTATETKGLEEGLTPREICDKYNKLHADIYNWFEISFDHFGRTTTQQQTQIAQDIFWRLHKGGYLLEDSMSQQLCVKCDRFLADRFIEGTCPLCGYEDARGDQCDACGKLINAIDLKAPRCKLCKSTPVVKSSKHLFLDLPKLFPKQAEWFDKVAREGMWTSNAKIIVQSWMKEGLKPRCITRDLKWGTPVPLEGFTDKVFYVWFDAPIGYLSITANYTDEWERWWKNPSQVQLYQFMAKDNVPFHGIIFPCTQLGADDKYTLVNHLIATEYLNYEDDKFSKSRGVGVFGDQAKETGILSDIWRFYLLYTRPESQDSAFSWSDLMLKNNSELLNNFGNFINRALMFLANNFGGVIPEITLNEEDKLYLAYIARELNTYLDLLERVRIREAIRHILNISRRGNQHIQNNQPWVLVKGNPEEKARAGSLVGFSANVACLLSVMIQPYMPAISRTIQEQLDAPACCNVLLPYFVCYLPGGHKIGKPSPLFQKLESQHIVTLKKRFAGKPSSRETTPNPVERRISESSTIPVNYAVNDDDKKCIEELEQAILEQGGVVRKLKVEKAAKTIIEAQVAILLKLKQQLLAASGQEVAVLVADKKKKKGKK